MRKAACLAALLLLPLASFAETFAVEAPEGFKLVHRSDSGALALTEYVAETDTDLTAWRDGIVVATLRGTDLSPTDFVALLDDDLARACPEAFAMDPDQSRVGDRAATLSIHACPRLRVNGRPEVSVLRVVEGDGALHAAMRVWVVSPPRDDLDRWTDWLRGLELCSDDCP